MALDDNLEMEKEVDPKKVPFWTSSRFGLAAIGFFGTMNLYALRINLSVAMVCMVNQTALDVNIQPMAMTTTFLNVTSTNESLDLNATSASKIDDKCGGNSGNATNLEDGPFVWDKATQGLMLGSFFWGYLITQLPGGILATRFGGKRTIGFFMFAASIATLLTPVGARVHYIFLIVLRVICGMGSGVWFPGFHALWSSWAPPLERSKLLGFTYSGAQVGNIITLPLAGVLCKYGFDGGWPSIFYVLGSLSVIWVVLWMVLVSDNPSEHPRIGSMERRYIRKSLRGQMEAERSHKLHIPVKAIVTSMPVWAIVVANFCSDWGVYTFLTQIPSYMNDVLKFDIATNGFLSALPYIGFWLMVTAAGVLSDVLRKRHLLGTSGVRKLFNSLASFTPALLIIVVGFLDCTKSSAAVATLTIGVAFSGCFFSGFIINPVDIAPKYSGIVFGISNTIASISGFAAPWVVGVVTEDKSRESWQTVFYICAAIFAFGAIFFNVFGSGELQSWAYTKDYTIDVETSMANITSSKEPMLNGSAGHDGNEREADRA